MLRRVVAESCSPRYVKPFSRPPLLHLQRASSSNGVRYPLQLSSVSEEHAALYAESLEHPEQFWGDLARRKLSWTREFDQVMDCDMNAGRISWFNGGKLNVTGKLLFQLVLIRYFLLVRHRN